MGFVDDVICVLNVGNITFFLCGVEQMVPGMRGTGRRGKRNTNISWVNQPLM